MIKFYLPIILFFIINSYVFCNLPELELARKLYYQSVKDEDKLEQALIKFESIKNTNSKLSGLSITYIGSLTMLKGKHAFWPHKKVQFVNDGLKIMDEGISLDKNNIESHFIYGSSCYYLPFFLGKKDLAIEKLKRIVTLIDDNNINNYDPEILSNALKFIIEKIELTNDEKSKLNKYLTIIESKIK